MQMRGEPADKQPGMFWSEADAEHFLIPTALVLGPHDTGAWAGRPTIIAQHRTKARRWGTSELADAA